VLKPAGRLVFSEWDATSPESSVLLASLVAKYGTTTPSRDLVALRDARQLARDSKEMADPESVTRALRSAGFRHVQVVPKAFPTAYASVQDFLDFECAWGPVEREVREMSEDARRHLAADLADGLEGLRAGRFEETWRVNVFVARPE
jgi:hypothetical protein